MPRPGGPRWPLLLACAEGIRDSFLRDESQLSISAGLIAQNACLEALNVLDRLPHAITDVPGSLGELCILRGRTYDGLG
ncbi:hypothetical protein [Streptomyces sp. NPDC052107]|uniref:hypothetical protein n=1 Tax=Streptomyces sp. NPDC052107 TaxID=3155632 RepID=UPI00341915C5